MKPVFHRITMKLFAAITLSLTLSLVGITLLLFVYFRSILLQQSKENQLSLVTQSSVNIDNIICELKQMVYYLSCDKMIPQIIEEPLEGIASANLSRELKSRFYTYTSASLTPAYIDCNSFLFVSNQFSIAEKLKAITLSELKNENARVGNSNLVEYTSWYRETIRKNGDMGSFVFDEIPGYIYFTNLQRNIYLSNPDYNDEIGAVAFAVKQRYITSYLELAKPTPRSDVIFLYGDTIMCSTNADRYPSGQEITQITPELVAPDSREDNQEIDLFGETCWVVNKPTRHDWTIVLITPQADILQGLNDMLRIVWFELLLALAGGMLLSRIVSSHFTNPIAHLSDVMQTVDSEEQLQNMTHGVYPEDEVGMLYQSFERMLVSIQKLFKEKEESIIAQNESKFHVLQLQMNPHFIYNTLESINCIALSEGQEDISEIAGSLIAILRYSIKYMKENSTLEHEICYLKSYINIQRLRFGNNFTFQCDIDEADYGVEIPQMSLQPLVENALFYAVTAEDVLHIRLSARVNENSFEICVADNGTQGDAQLLNLFLQGQATVKVRGEGIGIQNVNERIQMQFGVGSGLHYECSEQRMKAVITLVKK